MGVRMDAVWRIVGLIYLLSIGWVVYTIAFLAGLLWMFTDVTVQLVFGQEGMPNKTTKTTRFLKRLYEWGEGQITWTLFGKGEFPFLP